MNNHQDWINKCQHWKNKWPIFNIKDNDDSEGINIYSFIEMKSYGVNPVLLI